MVYITSHLYSTLFFFLNQGQFTFKVLGIMNTKRESKKEVKGENTGFNDAKIK
jgi:hypothetical protein